MIPRNINVLRNRRTPRRSPSSFKLPVKEHLDLIALCTGAQRCEQIRLLENFEQLSEKFALCRLAKTKPAVEPPPSAEILGAER